MSLKRWTKAEDVTLRTAWETAPSLSAIAEQLPGRSLLAIYLRAKAKGLTAHPPEGWEVIAHAARRTGYDFQGVLGLAKRYRVPVRVALSNPQSRPRVRSGPRRWIHIEKLDAAIAKHLERETVYAAARRVGITPGNLRRRLILAKVIKQPSKGHTVTVTEQQVQRALVGFDPRRREAQLRSSSKRKAA